MPHLKRLGVVLHSSPADAVALAFAGGIAKIGDPELVHVVLGPEAGTAEQPSPSEDELRSAVFTACPDLNRDRCTFEIAPRAEVRGILRSIRDREITTVIVGRRLPTDQLAIGRAYARLARKAPCNVIVVTEFSTPHFDRMLIPVDFSEHSKLAIAVALSILRAGKSDRPQVILQHNVESHYGGQYTGATLEERLKILAENARRDLDEFTEDLDFAGVGVEKIITTSSRPEEAVAALAAARKMDFVVIGSRGRDTLFGALLGSVAERVLEVCSLPVIIAKPRGEALKTLEMILQEGR